VNVRFACPACEAPNRLDRPGPHAWSCVACGHAADLPPAAEAALSHCVVCGNANLYRQKDFPQWLGLSVLALACASFFVLQVLYHPWWAWTVLLGSAALDGLLYYGLVGDVVVCYRCGAQHRGIPSRSFDPFELAIAERYRQERIRREQLQAGKKE
jgi:predicted RNA-binding Zn-ribbon protein involved in translation (DUF1610 family)